MEESKKIIDALFANGLVVDYRCTSVDGEGAAVLEPLTYVPEDTSLPTLKIRTPGAPHCFQAGAIYVMHWSRANCCSFCCANPKCKVMHANLHDHTLPELPPEPVTSKTNPALVEELKARLEAGICTCPFAIGEVDETGIASCQTCHRVQVAGTLGELLDRYDQKRLELIFDLFKEVRLRDRTILHLKWLQDVRQPETGEPEEA